MFLQTVYKKSASVLAHQSKEHFPNFVKKNKVKDHKCML